MAPPQSLPAASDLRDQAAAAVGRGRETPERERAPLRASAKRRPEPAEAFVAAVGAQRASRLAKRFDEAAAAFASDRFGDAQRLLKPLVKEAPDVADSRELLGLTLYRLGRWREAIEELELFRTLAGSAEQNPVLADCHRALGRWADVDALWRELGEVSPSAEIVTEGRIVLAGSHADRGNLAKAISLLEKGWKLPKRPRQHHLRRAYALADLYDRSGRAPRARELFRWVAEHDPDLADARQRARALS